MGGGSLSAMNAPSDTPGGKSATLDFDGPLHIVDYGGEGPPLVLIHGLGGSHLNWMLVARPLSSHFRVVAVDLPGFGLTPPAGRSSAVRDQAALVARYLAAEFDEPAYLVGNSMGGLVALLTADRSPEVVAGLILIDPALPPDAIRRPSLETVRFLGVPLLPFIGVGLLERQRQKLSVRERVLASMEFVTSDHTSIPEEVLVAGEAMEEARREMPWSIPSFIDAGRSIARVLANRGSFVSMIHRIGPPVMMVHGAKDDVVPIEFARAIADERPDWEFVVYHDVGHVPQLEAPDKLIRAIVDWELRQNRPLAV